MRAAVWVMFMAGGCVWIPGYDGSDTGDVGVVDADGDGYAVADDCDDDDPAVHPAAVELCNGVDDDCDGAVDADDPDVQLITWYFDADGDGFGADEAGSVDACDPPANHAAGTGDCDDLDPDVRPGADETCDDDGIDTNCDGYADLGADGAVVWFVDSDGDGHGDPSTDTEWCDDPGTGWTILATDCDDSDPNVSPDDLETCDADDVDEDCDGLVNDAGAVDCVDWYRDGDRDGWGDGADSLCLCDASEPYDAGSGGDCDDTDATASPGDLTCRWTGSYAAADLASSVLSGAAEDAQAGASLWASGDLNADGAPDLLVSSGWVGDSRALRAVYGPLSSAVTLDESLLTFSYVGEQEHHLRAALVGRVNDDVYDDFLTVFPESTAGINYHGIFLAAGPISAGGVPDYQEVATAGYLDNFAVSMHIFDADGDGVGDLVANGRDGSGVENVYVFAGPLTAASRDAAMFIGTSGTAFGSRLGDGDLNGDGFQDLVVADQLYSGANGRVVAYLGPLSGTTAAGGEWDLRGGTEVARGAGAYAVSGLDLTGDGVDDLVTSCYACATVSESEGEVYVIAGGESNLDGLLTDLSWTSIQGQVAGDGVGTEPTVLDYDGDGVGDLVFAMNPDGALYEVVVVYGPLANGRFDVDDAADLRLAATEANLSVYPWSAGDLNGDAIDDLLIRGPDEDTPGGLVDAGLVWMIPGGG